MNVTGFVLPALAIGLGSISIKPNRGFYFSEGPISEINAQVTLEEIHRDDLEITQHPVEKGSPISDHAFKRPAEVVIKCAWSNSPSYPSGLQGLAVGVAAANIPLVRAGLTAAGVYTAAQSLLSGNDASQVKAIYEKLIELQTSCAPFSIMTGKRSYKNMLFKSIAVTTDQETENVLMLTLVCQQVLIAQTKTVTMPVNQDAQASPEKTTPISDAGTKQLKG